MRTLTLISILAAASLQQTPPAVLQPVLQPVQPAFAAGETLDYSLSWMKMSGGSARMTVAPHEDGTKLRMTFVGKSGSFFSRIFKVRDEIESIVRRETFSTIAYTKRLDEKGRKKDEFTLVDEETRTATRKGKSFPVPAAIVDPLSVMYLLRTVDLSPGASHEFTVMADGKVYQLVARVLRKEVLRTEAGTFRTVLVEPKMREGGVFGDGEARLLIWYSDDDRRLPVRIRSEVGIGAITASLRAFSTGVSSIEPPLLEGQ